MVTVVVKVKFLLWDIIIAGRGYGYGNGYCYIIISGTHIIAGRSYGYGYGFGQSYIIIGWEEPAREGLGFSFGFGCGFGFG